MQTHFSFAPVGVICLKCDRIAVSIPLQGESGWLNDAEAETITGTSAGTRCMRRRRGTSADTWRILFLMQTSQNALWHTLQQNMRQAECIN